MKFLCPSCERIADIASFRIDGGALALTCSKCAIESRDSSAALPVSRREPAAALGMPPPAPASAGSTAIASSAILSHPPASNAAPSVALETTAPPTPGDAPEGPARVAFLRAVSPNAAYPSSREDAFSVPEGYCPKCVSLKRMESPACASCGLLFAFFNPDDHRPPAAVADAWQTLVSAWEDNAAHDRFLQFASGQGGLAAAGRLYRIQLAHSPDDPYAARGRDEVFRMAAASAPLAISEDRLLQNPRKRAQQLMLGAALAFLLVVLVVIFRSLRTLGAQ